MDKKVSFTVTITDDQKKDIDEVVDLLKIMPENMRMMAKGFLMGVLAQQGAEIEPGNKHTA